MLIRASAKFRNHYSCIREERDFLVRPFPLTWNLDLTGYGRNHLLILASEEYSLFSLLIPTSRARSLETFLKPFRQRLLQLFENVRLWEHRQLDECVVSGRTDRKIIGSQNDLLSMTRHWLANKEKSVSPEQLQSIEEHLNSTPMSYLLMASPLQAFWQQTEKLRRE